jgi:hypothetical protein
MNQIRAFGLVLPTSLDIGLDEDFLAKGKRKLVTQIAVHESVTHDGDVLEDKDGERDDATERGLRRRKLGVHFMIGVNEDTGGVQVVQHNDLADELHHTGGPVNDLSVGIEVIGPFYGPQEYWQKAIRAPWAHKGRYVLPLLIQCEALWGLVVALTDASQRGDLGMMIPRQFWGSHPKGFRMGVMPSVFDRSTPGILAHHQYGHHSDGCFPVLYCTLRDLGFSSEVAYDEAVRRATGAKVWAR